MIVMINGAFGVGKSTTAELLQTKLPNSMIYDPEEVGLMLRKVTAGVRLPNEDTDDFQDIELWPRLTVTVAEHLLQQYHRHLIVPMTLANIAYFRQIRDGLARLEPELYHFCLMASYEVIYQRLAERGTEQGDWPFQQTQRCLEALKSLEFQIHVDVEGYNVKQVVETILRYIQI
jgi:deoxyadenosine/deoxycytidine kinase